MARAAPTIPVSAKMYRHFAVITVGITGCLALFADGEQQEAIRDQIAQQQEAKELRDKERELAKSGKGGNSNFIISKSKTKGRFGNDKPMKVHTNSSGIDPGSPELVAGSFGPDYPIAGAGPSMDAIPMRPEGMPDEAYEQYKREFAERMNKRKQPSKASVERMIEASKARSQTRSFF